MTLSARIELTDLPTFIIFGAPMRGPCMQEAVALSAWSEQLAEGRLSELPCSHSRPIQIFQLVRRKQRTSNAGFFSPNEPPGPGPADATVSAETSNVEIPLVFTKMRRPHTGAGNVGDTGPQTLSGSL